ncbi:MAG: hypothetical protein OHK0039_05850 [Bacteroidia bacterium]
MLLWLPGHIVLTSAQPTLSPTLLFELGESAPVSFLDEYFQPGASGAGVVWDRSSLPPASHTWEWKAEQPVGSAYADSFPGATHLFRSPSYAGGDTTENYLYYRLAGDRFEWLGAASVAMPAGVVLYSLLDRDPQTQLWLALGYQQSHTDTFAGVNWVSLGGVTYQQRRWGVVTHHADAYGALTTPLGTFDPVLRVKTVEEIYDTLQAVVAVASQQRNVRYAWYAPGERYLLLQMDSLATIQPGFTQVVKHAQYRTGGISASVDELGIGLQVYPQPARDHVGVRLAAPVPVRLSLLSMAGQTLRTHIPAYTADSYRFDLTSIAAGCYLLRVQTGDRTAVLRLLIY